MGHAVISLGADGALSASPHGVWHARPSELAVRNTVGAGDAMVAALSWALARSLAPREALRLAAALSAAAAASGAPVPSLELFDELMPRVSIEVLSPRTAAPSAREVVS